MVEELNKIIHAPEVWMAFGILVVFAILLRISAWQEQRYKEEQAAERAADAKPGA